MQYHNDLTVELLQQLIRIPSENNGVTGYENEVQKFYADWLVQHGIEAKLIYPENIPGFDQLPGRLLEHNMTNRPTVIASLKGNRPGIKRLFLAHADTVPVGKLSGWSDSPFSGKIENGCIYGRGASDDKWGLAVMASLLLTLKSEGGNFPGEVIIASVPDEESGGGNGTLTALVSIAGADEAIYLDGGSNQTLWASGLGGGFFRGYGEDPAKIRQVLMAEKEDIRKRLDTHPAFGPDFFPMIEKQFYSVAEAADGSVSCFLDVLPGEDEEDLKKRIEAQLPGCRIEWMSRFLKPHHVTPDTRLVTTLRAAFQKVTGRELTIIGGVQSDAGLVNFFGKIPCVAFGCGRRGLPGSSHQYDEFVEIKAMAEVEDTLLTLCRENG
ncbi:MAG: M20 family metallopeptidase [Lentisphaeria bacterium]|nr:M20 family metallopeptidase [Lentisphaeria bacterium]